MLKSRLAGRGGLLALVATLVIVALVFLIASERGPRRAVRVERYEPSAAGRVDVSRQGFDGAGARAHTGTTSVSRSPSGERSVTGRCKLEDGTPVVDVVVDVFSADRMAPPLGREAWRVTVGRDGEWVVRLAPSATVDFRIGLRGSETARTVVDVTVPLGSTLHLGDVVLARGLRIYGRVETTAGVAVPGATVHWAHARPQSREYMRDRSQEGAVVTDEEGEFACPPLGYGRALLTVTHAEYGSHLRGEEVTLHPGVAESGRRVVIRIARPEPLALVVLDREGRPVPDVEAFLPHWPRMWSYSRLSVRPRSDAGAWDLLVPDRAGGGLLEVRAQGYRSALVGGVALGAGPIEVHLTRGQGLAVTICEGLDRATLVYALLVKRGRLLSLSALREARVSDDRVLIDLAPEDVVGRRVVLLDRSQASYGLTRAISLPDLDAGAEPVPSLCEALPTLSVRCVDAASRQPVAGARVDVMRKVASGKAPTMELGHVPTQTGVVDPWKPLWSVSAGSDGHAGVRVIPPVPLTLRVSADGWSEEFVDVPGDLGGLVVPLGRESRIEVTKTGDERGRTPVVLFDRSRWRWIEPVSRSADQVVFTGLAPGIYVAGDRALLPATLDMQRDELPLLGLESLAVVELRAGERRSVSLRCDGAGWVYGQIDLPFRDAGPLTVDVVPAPLARRSVEVLPAAVDDGAEFQVGPLAPGEYVIRLFRPPTQGPVSSSPVRIDPRVMHGVRIHASWSRLVLRAAGRPPAGATIGITTDEGKTAYYGSFTGDGQVVHLAPGTYHMKVRSGTDMLVSHTLEVSLGTTEITITD